MSMPAPDCPLHVFDMDHTLINSDCDVSWKTFLKQRGMVEIDETFWRDFHYRMYRLGRLNPPAYLAYQLKQFVGRTPEEMQPMLDKHFSERIEPTIYTRALELLEQLHREEREMAICTSTTAPLARPVQRHLRIPHLIATDLEIRDGVYTGGVAGTYCFEEGKIDYVQRFCAEHGFEMKNAAYYGDSISDIPILEAVGYPVACNPAEGLRRHALEREWPILEFEDGD